jgi:SseB protein N-terminal domain/SseB protein C-terminal domain
VSGNASKPSAEEPGQALTALVEQARRGLRRDVSALVAGLETAELFVALKAPIAGAPEGEDVEFDEDLEIVPHLLADEEGHGYAALFTSPEIAEPVAQSLGWTTEGEELSLCTLPARIALELALGVIDETHVLGLVIDAGNSSELMLRRQELASIVAGQALPLVGYLVDLPPLDDEQVLLAEPSDPPPPALVAALAAFVTAHPEISAHRLERTFNPERDLEPHLTLRFTLTGDHERRALAQAAIEAVGELVPPPGYLDILFDDG